MVVDSQHRQVEDGPGLGLLAGWGDYPLVLAEALRQLHRRVYCLGVKGHADRRLAEVCHEFRWIGLARLGKAIRYFRSRGVETATMAGKIHKVLFFRPWTWLRLAPDWRAVRRFGPLFLNLRGDCKDDTLLTSLIEEFAQEGITFQPATDYAPELLVKLGRLTHRGPTPAQRKDVEFGWQIAKEMGRLDVGQTVVVKNRAVLAVEAIEGTDECIRRAGKLCPAGGFTVIKVAKPQQDMRFDVPTIGRGTLQSILQGKGALLAVEAGKTIIVNEEDVVDLANRHRLAIVAFSGEGQVASGEWRVAS